MTVPKYLEAFRRAAHEAQTREKREVSEKRGSEERLISLTSLISPPEASQNVCAVCGEASDLWKLDAPTGQVPVHQECATFLPKPELAEPSAAYQATSAEPEGNGCRVEIVELPQAQRYRRTFAHLQLKPPALVDIARWRECVEDGKRFLAKWGNQAEALGWTSGDLFGLHQLPDKPHPSYNRLSRYDWNGLCWLLQGRSVTVLTENSALIENMATGSTSLFRKNNHPALEPLGDDVFDIKPRSAAISARVAKMSTLQRTTFKTGRLLEFCTRKELTIQTGQQAESWPLDDLY